MVRTSLIIIGALALIAQPWPGQAQPFNIFEAVGGGINAIGGAVVGGAKAVGGAVGAVAVGSVKLIGNVLNGLGGLGQAAAQNFRGLAQGFGSAAENIIQGAAHNVEQAVTQLVKIVSPCFDGKIDLNAIRETALGLTIGCVQERISEAKGILDGASEAVKEIISISTEVKDKCGGGLDGLECAAANLAPQAAEISSNITEAVKSTVSMAQNLILNVQSDMQSCVQNKASQAVVEATNVAKEIAQCAAANLLNAANNAMG